MNFYAQFREDQGLLRGFIEGEIDTFTAPMLREEFDSIHIYEGLRIELDLSKVNFMDSTGLGVFVAFYKRAMKENANLKLVALSNRITRLFEITGLSELIEIESIQKVGGNDESI